MDMRDNAPINITIQASRLLGEDVGLVRGFLEWLLSAVTSQESRNIFKRFLCYLAKPDRTEGLISWRERNVKSRQLKL